MKKRTAITFTVVGSVVLLGGIAAFAGPALYRDFIAAPAAPAPTLTADDSTFSGEETETLAADLAGTWTVSAGSYAGYRVDEVLNGTEVTVTGRTNTLLGSLTVDEELTLTEANFEVDVASITTDSSHRDDFFRDTAMRAGTYPTATFVLTDSVSFSEVPASGDVVEQQVTGTLTLAGVTQPVTFTVKLQGDGTSVEMVGQIPITFLDFGVTAPQLGFVQVEPTGFVEFNIIAEQAPAR